MREPSDRSLCTCLPGQAPSPSRAAAASALMRPCAQGRWSWLQALLLLPLLALSTPAPTEMGGSAPAWEVVVPKQLPGGSDGEDAGLVILLSAFGRSFELRLKPDSSFLAPGLKVERIGGSLGEAEVELEPRGCFYSGTVHREAESLAAVSVCHGLSGSFVLPGEEFTVQPLDPDSGASSINQPHLVQRWGRTADTRGAAGERVGEHQGSAKTEGPGRIAHPRVTRRKKRFVNEPLYLEMMLVADETLANFYGASLQSHILTLISVAARIFKHASIKNYINLVVVKVLIIDDNKLGPTSSRNGMVLLDNFCAWQRSLNQRSDRHPEHYDTAVLLTRKTLCLDNHICNALGIAEFGSICNPNRSCSIVRDKGLEAAYTLVHELGHVLSILHDDSTVCMQDFGNLDRHHLMSPIFKRVNHTLPWSPCSAKLLTEFLDEGHGNCLLDAPTGGFTLPTSLPGSIPLYNLDQQCRQLFGHEFKHCEGALENPCSQLWCYNSITRSPCLTKIGFLPWLDGTPCREGYMCFGGSCLPDKEAKRPKVVVDGNWSSWGPWGECSRTCGGGIQYRHRDCTNPEPQNTGKYCLGWRTAYRICNSQECPEREKSIRDQQCEQFNALNHTDADGNLIQWVPKYTGVPRQDSCKLICQDREGAEYKTFRDKVVDGTPCGLDTDFICVNGDCVTAGCDHVLGSLKKRDMCGVCGGDGSTCRRITGYFNPTEHGYNDIITFPVGATNIEVKQSSKPGLLNDGSYLALKAANGQYLLNGNYFVISTEMDIYVQDTVIQYSGCFGTLEQLQTFQPLPEPVTVQVLMVAEEEPPPTVEYSFSLPYGMELSELSSVWKGITKVQAQLGDAEWIVWQWHDCSSTCGAGWQLRLVECRSSSTGELAFTCDESQRPPDFQACKLRECPQ